MATARGAWSGNKRRRISPASVTSTQTSSCCGFLIEREEGLQLKRLDPAIKYRKSATRPSPDHQGEPFPIKRYRRFHPLERSIAAVLVNRCSHLGGYLIKKMKLRMQIFQRLIFKGCKISLNFFPLQAVSHQKIFQLLFGTAANKDRQTASIFNASQCRAINNGWVPLDCSPQVLIFFTTFFYYIGITKSAAGVRRRSFP